MVPAMVLAQLEKDLGVKIHQKVNMFAGTSTGGIISIGLSIGTEAQKLVQLYQEKCEQVHRKYHHGVLYNLFPGFVKTFIDKYHNAYQIWHPKYTNTGLENLLNETINDNKKGDFKKLSDAKTHLIVSATDMSNEGRPHGWFFTNTGSHKENDAADPEAISDEQISLVDIALATSAAPTFFPCKKIGKRNFADGALVASNPSMFAQIEAERLTNDPNDILHISFGTGYSKGDENTSSES